MREIICNPFFPKHFHTNIAKNMYKNTSILSIGGNLKNPIKTFISLLKKLCKNNNINIISTSPIYKNPPFGYTKQNDFYNATLILTTKLCLLEFYSLVFYLERIFGRERKRAFKNAPRALDIDILFFNDIFVRNKNRNITHLEWENSGSVLVPLNFKVN